MAPGSGYTYEACVRYFTVRTRGSRVRVYLRGVRAVFHRPHPQKETDKGALRSLQRFLSSAGVGPEDED